MALYGQMPGMVSLTPGTGDMPELFLILSKDGRSPYSVLQALTFIIFICFTASISAYMAAALLEFLITLTFLFFYATQYYQRFDQLNWPCLDFLRCLSAIIIFLVVSFAAVTSREGAAIAAFVFGIILVSVFAYDAFKIYRTEMAPRATQGTQQ
ncbi:CKLF-like MARVEL transmembrane domain-containing protein 5 isoform X2 [Marmota marmota marmota]|uniref:CKLF-like MARVEL transmembrane domain-containing protein 5 isoform X2 n=1 Tax=Marmota marmota marmota TaxID=9994 RepID=UPI0020934AC0|nr:CKLF-like MARVEL transmembrane domain-containing protein 5 isoform X2 [Marmota marmota marmota]